ncbi:MAG: M20 family metallopeptidase [Dehalococcoidales bacterium]|nr:M20 family metallopeptidase [Dehalococcoidales bacterium]
MAGDFAAADTALGLTQALVRIPSENPIGKEAECARFVAEWFRRLGVTVTVDELAPGRPNVIARLPGGSEPPLVYLAHLDTVPAGQGWSVDPFGGIVHDGRLYGRGAADMKSGVAAAMMAMKQIAESGIVPKRDFLVCATVDEEGASMLGAVDLVKRGLVGADALIVASEPTSLDLVVAQKGVMWYRLETWGKMAHAGTPHIGADALYGLAKAIVAIKEAFAALPYDHPILGRATVTVGQAAGGVKTNVVPDQAWAEIDTRLVPPLMPAAAESMIREVVEAAASSVPGVQGAVSVVTIDRPPVEASADSPLLPAFAEAFKEATAKEIRQSGFPAYTDAAIIAAMTGNPNCVLFGPGHLEQAHTVDEFVPVEEIEVAAAVLGRTAAILLGP